MPPLTGLSMVRLPAALHTALPHNASLLSSPNLCLQWQHYQAVTPARHGAWAVL